MGAAPGQGPCTEEEEEQQCQTPAADRGLKEPELRTWESTMMFFISKTSRMFLGLFSVWIPFLLGSRTRLGVCFQALNHCYLPSPPRWVGVKGAVPRVPVGTGRGGGNVAQPACPVQGPLSRLTSLHLGLGLTGRHRQAGPTAQAWCRGGW